jgi:Ca-activated chloride channel family protein
MQELVGGLKPQETFNILFFSGGSQALRPTPLPATHENLQRALTMMQSLDGGGGTELVPALKRALAMPRTPDTARSIVVVTDGYVSVEREAYDLVRANRNSTNLFAFGIGSAVNRYLIEGLARAGDGEPFIVTGASEVARVGRRFRRYVEAPLLSNIKVRGDGVELYDVEPAEIPVMLAERPIVLLGKYRSPRLGATLELTGRNAAGEYRSRVPLADSGGERRAGLIPILWARQRLVRLSDLQGEEVEARHDEILALGLHYSLLTRYTSFVAIDETVANPAGDAAAVKQPLPLPQGVSGLALARPVPEPDVLWLLAGLAMLAGASRLARKVGHGRS